MSMPQTALTLAAAARLAGVDKSTLRRAVKAGKLSAVRDEFKVWHVEASELERLYPLAPPGEQIPEADPGALPRHALGNATPDAADRATDALVAELRAVIADLRGERDRLLTIAERQSQAALPAPQVERPVSWWRRLRSTAFFAAIVLGAIAFAHLSGVSPIGRAPLAFQAAIKSILPLGSFDALSAK